MKIVFEATKSSRGWKYRQAALNVKRFAAEELINKACKQATIEIQRIINLGGKSNDGICK